MGILGATAGGDSELLALCLLGALSARRVRPSGIVGIIKLKVPMQPNKLTARIHAPAEEIEQFCRKNHVRKLALFGSVLRDDFRPDSDVDVLIEFEPGKVPGLLGLARMERELSAIFGNRRVDIRTAEDLSPYFRQDVVESAEIQYSAG